MHSFLVSVFFLLSSCIVYGQHFSLQQYTAADGLPQSQVTALVEDDNGYMWVGTIGGGLARFDNREFKVYNASSGLLSNMVNGLLIDHKKDLWIWHPKGVSKFDKNGFKKFQLDRKEKMIRRIFEFNDTIFFITGNGQIGKILGDKMKLDSSSVTSNNLYFIRYSTKEIYFFLNDKTILIKSKKKERRVSYKDTFSEVKNTLFINNNLILMTDKGYFEFDSENLVFKPIKLDVKNSILSYDSATKVFWTTSKRCLLKEYSIEDKPRIDTVLKDVEINQILKDNQSNTWFATSGAGLYRYFIQDFDKCSSPSMKTVMTITKDTKGATWIGTANQGIKRILKGKVSSYTIGPTEFGRAIRQISQSPDGTIWAGSFGGLARFDEQRNQFKVFTEKEGLPYRWVSCFDFDVDGSLWIATPKEVFNFKNDKVLKGYQLESGLGGIFSILNYRPSNKIFLGTNTGLNSIDSKGKLSKVTIPQIQNSAIYSIHIFRDSLLLIGSSDAGAVIYNPKSAKYKIYNVKNGLLSDLIYFISSDSEGYIWIGTERGINKIKLDKEWNIVENFNYSRNNGLTGMETNHDAFYLGKEKYFGLVDGLYQYNDLKQFPNKNYQVHLTAIDLFYGRDSAATYSDSVFGFFKLPYHPEFPNEKNHVTFHFNRVDKRYPHSIRFQYQLENFETAWSEPSSIQQVTYSNLPPGDYVFKVKSSNSKGLWTDAPLTYSFSVLTPFYLKTWFIVSIIVLLIFSIVMIIYWRIRSKALLAIQFEKVRFQEQELIRKTLARDFHDEMGNQLTRIINYISLLKLNKEGNGNIELYNKVEASAKYLYTGTRDFLWSIDPTNDDLVKIFIHIKDFADNLLQEKNIDLRVYNGVTQKFFLVFGMSREITLIFKEALTNVFHHSKAKNVTFSLKPSFNQFEISLEDDGVGFIIGDVKKLNGIANMRDRAKRIDAILRITSGAQNKGTTVTLIIKKSSTKVSKYDISF